MNAGSRLRRGETGSECSYGCVLSIAHIEPQEAPGPVLDPSQPRVPSLCVIPVRENANARTSERPDPSGLQ